MLLESENRHPLWERSLTPRSGRPQWHADDHTSRSPQKFFFIIILEKCRMSPVMWFVRTEGWRTRIEKNDSRPNLKSAPVGVALSIELSFDSHGLLSRRLLLPTYDTHTGPLNVCANNKRSSVCIPHSIQIFFLRRRHCFSKVTLQADFHNTGASFYFERNGTQTPFHSPSGRRDRQVTAFQPFLLYRAESHDSQLRRKSMEAWGGNWLRFLSEATFSLLVWCYVWENRREEHNWSVVLFNIDPRDFHFVHDFFQCS